MAKALSYPVSTNCPKCESTSFKKVKSEAELAFAPDRVCKECGPGDAPPMPPRARSAVAGLAGAFPGTGGGPGGGGRRMAFCGGDGENAVPRADIDGFEDTLAPDLQRDANDGIIAGGPGGLLALLDGRVVR